MYRRLRGKRVISDPARLQGIPEQAALPFWQLLCGCGKQGNLRAFHGEHGLPRVLLDELQNGRG